MDVANLLSHDPPPPLRPQQTNDTNVTQPELHRAHQYPTRHSMMTSNVPMDTPHSQPPFNSHSFGTNHTDASPIYEGPPATQAPKNVAFKLLFDGSTSHQARLPMRVQIFPHDTTESIVTTVQNFYGLYKETARGVSFEDDRGNTLIARYENFHNNMIVYVRVVLDYLQAWQPHGQIPTHTASPISAHRIHPFEEPFQMLPPQPAQALSYGQPISRPSSRVARKKSASPRPGRNSRSTSVQKPRLRTGGMSREQSFQSHLDNLNSDGVKGYTSSDGEGGSVTSSRKARSEQLASADISLDNILEGNRRKRAKFESSVSDFTRNGLINMLTKGSFQELPLFVPPQVPAANSTSSISPQRRSNPQDHTSPFVRPMQRTSGYGQPLQSPHSYGFGEYMYGIAPPQHTTPSTAPPAGQNGRRLRDRSNAPTLSARSSTGMVPRAQGFGVLPTPDPTIASCISDEDVALQLMRLGDASNISHGRTSASTLDETLSGRADVASSVTSDNDEDSDHTEQPSLPMAPSHKKPQAAPALRPTGARRQLKQPNDGLLSLDSAELSGDDVDDDYLYDDKKDGVFKSDPDDMSNEFGQVTKSRPTGLKQRNGSKASSVGSIKNITKSSKSRSGGIAKKTKTSALSMTKIPPIPMSPPQSRKASATSTVNFQHQGEEDLSTKPRCQRCRKSKKGCDRQRPCQRCSDAGIGPDGCISEDEGNGRKGRFGRHMGVAVKQDTQTLGQNLETEEVSASYDGLASGQEKSKKRKR